MIVPNNATRYGGLAGKIIAGAENEGKLWAVGRDKVLQSWSVPVNIEGELKLLYLLIFISISL